MDHSTTEFIKTDLAIIVNCVCGSTIAASLIVGGDIIDEDMTKTMAEYYLKGGKVELISCKEKPISFKECTCSNLKVSK